MSHRGAVGGRGGGKGASASGAYQDGKEYYSEREGASWDYTGGAKRVVATDILAPARTPAAMTASGERLWNWIEAAEDKYWDKRHRDRPDLAERHKETAQTFMSGHFTLANELSPADAETVVRRLLNERFVDRGMIVSFAIHGDPGNKHFHYQAPMRPFVDGEPGSRFFRRPEELRAWDQETRRRCAELQNEMLAERGLPVRVEARSFAEQGLELEPGVHIGPVGLAMAERGERSARVQANDDVMVRNAERVAKSPELILDLLFAEPGAAGADQGRGATGTGTRTLERGADADQRSLTASVATVSERDIARRVQRLTLGDEVLYAEVMAKVMADPRLCRLGVDADGRVRYTTSAYLEAETALFGRAEALKAGRAFGVRDELRDRTLASDRHQHLNGEQVAAVRWMTGAESLACVQGAAGTGKTTIMRAAKEIWEASGFRVRGAALAWSAAQVLEKETGISSQSIASLEMAIKNLAALEAEIASGGRDPNDPWVQARRARLGKEVLQAGEVLVVDEASMIDVRTAKLLLEHAHRVGAKVVLIGDTGQFQAIGAGRAFGGLVEKCGAAELKTIVRQKADIEDVLHHVQGLTREEARQHAATMTDEERRELVGCHGAEVERTGTVWRRQAAELFASGETRAALQMFDERGAIRFHDSPDEVRAALAEEYVAIMVRGGVPQALYAFTNEEVDDLNRRIRADLQQLGKLGDDQITIGGAGYSVGDRVVFTDNDRKNERVKAVTDRDAGPVFNNTVGTIVAIDKDRVTVELGDGRTVVFDAREWQDIRHGYAQSQYKSQGQTVGDGRDGHVHVAASRHMAADAAYVSFTRSRHGTTMHVSRTEFADLKTLADSLSRVPTKDLAGDYLRGDPERQAVVRALKECSRRYAQLMATISQETKGDACFSDHPRWSEVQAMMAERKELAKRIAADRPGFGPIVRQAGLPWERIEVAAGQRSRPLSEIEHEARARVTAYAKLATETRDLWNTIKLTHPGPRSKNHADFGHFDQLRQQRDALAAGLVAEKSLHRAWSREANISWRAIEAQAAAHSERATDASRQAAMTPEQRRLRELVAEYKQQRSAVRVAWTAGDRGEADRLAKMRDAQASAIAAAGEPGRTALAEGRLNDRRFDQHFRQAEARGLVNQFQRALTDRAEATAHALGQELLQQRQAERSAGGKVLARAVAEAGLNWRDIRAHAEGRAHRLGKEGDSAGPAQADRIEPQAEPQAEEAHRPPVTAPRPQGRAEDETGDWGSDLTPGSLKTGPPEVTSKEPKPFRPLPQTVPNAVVGVTVKPVVEAEPETPLSAAADAPVSEWVSWCQEVTMLEYQRRLVDLARQLGRTLDKVRADLAKATPVATANGGIAIEAKTRVERDWVPVRVEAETAEVVAAKREVNRARTLVEAAKGTLEKAEASAWPLSWLSHDVQEARNAFAAAERNLTEAVGNHEAAETRLSDRYREIRNGPDYTRERKATIEAIVAENERVAGLRSEMRSIENSVALIQQHLADIKADVARLSAKATILFDSGAAHGGDLELKTLLAADRRDIAAIANGERSVNAIEREAVREKAEAEIKALNDQRSRRRVVGD